MKKFLLSFAVVAAMFGGLLACAERRRELVLGHFLGFSERFQLIGNHNVLPSENVKWKREKRCLFIIR